MPFRVYFFVAFFFACLANAQQTDTVVNINGAITEATCSISISSEVNFGSVSAHDLIAGKVEKSINFTRNCNLAEANTKMRFVPAQGIVSGQTNFGKSIMKSGLNGIGIGVMKMGLYGALNFNEDYPYHEKTIDLKFKLLPITAEQMAAGNIDTSVILRLSYD
ncbi:fimbrial protein [Citrobacter werkmanii]|uniref:fimbrial protein n=1 Tax=Citrobacter werkmanii TaxID=67827 RepID=UPI00123A06C2|nr:fimbrial protein [Citrobacter werkmanii]QET68086.1 type 1 fimbrial protein [Citrobacter werkmanii]